MFQDVTIIIKTFERPGALRKLLLSLDRHYGKDAPKVLVADDSREVFEVDFRTALDITVFKLPFDSGVSAGRNYLLERIPTRYFILLDDDFVFYRKTRIEVLLSVLENNPEVDLAAGLMRDIPKRWWKKRKTRDVSRTISISDNILRRSRTPVGQIGGFNVYSFLTNFFIARTDKIRGVKWDDYLKTVEHTAFYLDCSAKGIVCVEVPSVIVNHRHMAGSFYNRYRNDRQKMLIGYLHRKYGYEREIETE